VDRKELEKEKLTPPVSLDWAVAHKYTEEQWEAAFIGFTAFHRWFTSAGIEIVEQEMQLVSEEHQYGGTPDAVGRYPDAQPGHYIMLDWKTGGLYLEHGHQVCGYVIAWEELHPGKVIDEMHLCTFEKEFGVFGHHSFPLNIIEIMKESFLDLVRVYKNANKVRKAFR